MHWHITSAADENYIPHIACLLQSIINNSEANVEITFHLLANQVSNESLSLLREQTEERCTLVIYDVSDLQSTLPPGIPPSIAITSYARLLLPNIIHGDINTILYLDCDTIVNSSLSPLFELQLATNLAAGVLDTLPDSQSKTSVDIREDAPYYNAGMLLINLKAWKKENIQSSFFEYLISKNGNVHHHDQGILNHVMQGKIITLPPEYNLTSNYFTHPYKYLKERNTPFYSEEEITQAKKKPTIIHYTEGFLLRPWVAGCKHPMKSLYLTYKSKTAWINKPLQKDKRPLYVKLQAFLFLYFPTCIYDVYCILLQAISSLKKKSN